MNTRSFFKSLTMLTVGVSVSPAIFIPKFESVKWVRTSPQLIGWDVVCDFDRKLGVGTWQARGYGLQNGVLRPLKFGPIHRVDSSSFAYLEEYRNWVPGKMST